MHEGEVGPVVDYIYEAAVRPELWRPALNHADRRARRREEGNLMANFSCASTKQTSHWRFRVILAAAAFALSGCNANQAINPSSQPPSQVFAGHYVDYNPYDPISYAQNNTGRGGGR